MRQHPLLNLLSVGTCHCIHSAAQREAASSTQRQLPICLGIWLAHNSSPDLQQSLRVKGRMTVRPKQVLYAKNCSIHNTHVHRGPKYYFPSDSDCMNTRAHRFTGFTRTSTIVATFVLSLWGPLTTSLGLLFCFLTTVKTTACHLSVTTGSHWRCCIWDSSALREMSSNACSWCLDYQHHIPRIWTEI